MQGFEVLYLPWEGLGMLLRTLSFSGAAGNAAAFFLYVLLSLFPMFYLGWKRGVRKKPLRLEDALLVLLSADTFYLLYAFINPALFWERLPKMAQDMGAGDFLPLMKLFGAGLWIALLISWMLLTLTRTLREKEVIDRKEFLFRGMRILIWAALLLSAASALVSVSGLLLDRAAEIRANAAGTGGDWLFVGLKAAAVLIPEGFLLGIFGRMLGLLKAVRREAFCPETVEAARKLAEVSAGTVQVSVLCSLAWNGALFLFGGYLTSVNYSFELSLFPLLMAFASLILTRYLKEAYAIRQDNEMII